MQTVEHHPLLATLTEDDTRQVRSQLDRLLESHQFRNSRRYPALLRFLVEETLEGRSDLLKERLIGIHVFGRPADYDTAADPIVRVTIAEIRKRIAQYYHDEEHDAEIRIELITGRYAPEFRLGRESRQGLKPSDLSPTIAPGLADTPDSTSPPSIASASLTPPTASAEVIPMRSRRAFTWSALAAVLLAAASFASWLWLRPSALDQFWSPILSPHRTVLFCLPTDVGLRSIRMPPSSENVIKSAGPSFLDHESLGENVVYSDVLATLDMANVLTTHHADYRLRLTPGTTLDDLRHGPAVLVGGLDNDWTMRALENLPYRFTGSDETTYWISARNAPNDQRWSLDLKTKYAAVTRDYALIARLRNDQTGEPEVIVAGIGMSGTAAAGEMVGDERLMQEVRRRIGAGYKDHDFEVVISTDVVNGVSGSPKILAVSVW